MKYHNVISEQWKAFLENDKDPSDPTLSPRDGAALKGQDRAARGRQQSWGGQPTAPLITDACGDRDRPRSRGDIKPVSQDLHQQNTGTAQMQPSSGRGQPREPQQPEEEEAAPAQAAPQSCPRLTARMRCSLRRGLQLCCFWAGPEPRQLNPQEGQGKIWALTPIS